MLVSFLTVSPGKHDSCLPPIPEPKPEQGFPARRQADQGHWAGTLQRFSGESPRPSGGVSTRRRTQRQLDFNTMTPNECSFAPGKVYSDFTPDMCLAQVQCHPQDSDLFHHGEGLTPLPGRPGWATRVTITQTDYENPICFLPYTEDKCSTPCEYIKSKYNTH